MAARRVVVARGIYAQLGGFSPLLANTQAQAHALEAELGAEYRCFIAMRYWYPLAAVVVGAAEFLGPPQRHPLPPPPPHSTTTTPPPHPPARRPGRRHPTHPAPPHPPPSAP